MRKTHTLDLEITCGGYVDYLCESRPSVEKVIVIAHNAKAFELHFILNRAILLKLQVEMIMNGLNYVHASGAFSVPRQRFISTVRVTQAARIVWANGCQVVVPSLLQYSNESRPYMEKPRHNILWNRRDEGK